MEKPKTRKEIVKQLVRTDLTEEEHDELFEMLIDNPLAVNLDKVEEEKLTLGDKVADKISEIAGSWSFIVLFCLFLLSWVIINTILMSYAPDPYPFILLNLVLSCLSAIQAPIIMMSQNRQAKKDSIRNENDYLTDLKSELILEELHREIEEVLKNQKKIIKMLDEKDLTEEKK